MCVLQILSPRQRLPLHFLSSLSKGVLLTSDGLQFISVGWFSISLTSLSKNLFPKFLPQRVPISSLHWHHYYFKIWLPNWQRMLSHYHLLSNLFSDCKIGHASYFFFFCHLFFSWESLTPALYLFSLGSLCDFFLIDFNKTSRKC